MRFMPYRRVLALPGVGRLILLGFVVRIPTTAIAVGLTLHVVNSLHRSYAAAGLVTAAYTIGAAVGSPWIGRLIDRRGARPALVLTSLAQAACWLTAPHLGYRGLIVAAVLGGLLALPVWGIVRQSIAAQVPQPQRRAAFALESMSVEVSFMIGPVAAVALSTGLPGGAALDALGAAQLLAGTLLFLVNPVTREEHAEQDGPHPSRRSWLRLPVVAVMLAGSAATFILSATDLGIVASARQDGATSWTGLIFAVWCGYSLLGGLVYGALHRAPPPLAIVAAMGLLTIPVGLAGDWRLLCVTLLPAGLLCAPTISACNDTLSRLVPARARGEAIGLFGSALTVGNTLGAPFAGLIIDRTGAGWAFAAAGALGAAAALVSLPAYFRSRGPSAGPADEAALDGASVDGAAVDERGPEPVAVG